MTDVVVSLEYYRAVACILRVPQENLSWYRVLNIFFYKIASATVLTTQRFCVPKFVATEPGL